MTRSVTWVSLATSVAMGQQHHESRLQHALRRQAGDGWQLSSRRVASLRSGLEGTLRLPLRGLAALPYGAAAAVGTLSYGRADLVHRFDLRCPPRAGAEVVTVHDLPPLRFDDEGSLPRWAARSARRALGVICPSRFAAEEIAALLRVERIWVVPNGVDLELARAEPMSDEELAARGIERPFVLHAGGATKRKNLGALADAWRRVSQASAATLVLCGPQHPRRDRLFRDLPRTVFLGHLEPLTVARLVRAAAAVVVPSLYEGFGLPALEGMAAGTPVVAATRGALPEVCGDAALLVEPTGQALAEALLEVIADGESARRLRELGPKRAEAFTWERAATETLRVYAEVLA